MCQLAFELMVTLLKRPDVGTTIGEGALSNSRMFSHFWNYDLARENSRVELGRNTMK